MREAEHLLSGLQSIIEMIPVPEEHVKNWWVRNAEDEIVNPHQFDMYQDLCIDGMWDDHVKKKPGFLPHITIEQLFYYGLPEHEECIDNETGKPVSQVEYFRLWDAWKQYFARVQISKESCHLHV